MLIDLSIFGLFLYTQHLEKKLLLWQRRKSVKCGRLEEEFGEPPVYWSAVSTPGELIEAKWISLDNHIHNKHKGHSKVFRACQHKPIRERAGRKKWFKPRMLLYMHITYNYALNLL